MRKLAIVLLGLLMFDNVQASCDSGAAEVSKQDQSIQTVPVDSDRTESNQNHSPHGYPRRNAGDWKPK